MSSLTIAVVMAFAVLTVWGAIAPRGQWRVLAGWTRRQPYAQEPGPVAVGVHRIAAIVASIVLIVGAFSNYSDPKTVLAADDRPAIVDPIKVMWGSPAPVVLNRIVQPRADVPAGLVEQPVLNYQAMNGPRRAPSYLFSLENYNPPAGVGLVGANLVGTAPSPGLSALDTAYLVIHVLADPNCIPQAVLVQQGDGTLSVGVYYGRPVAAAGQAPVKTNDCASKPSAKDAVSTLIPIPLEVALDGRQVVGLDGIAVPEVTPVS